MAIFINILLCGAAGILAALLGTIGSNQFIHGRPFYSGYEAVTEPFVFGGMGLLAGLIIGAGCVAWRRFSGSGNALLLGLSVTLASIGIVAGGATAKRYWDIAHEPTISGKALWLEFELRLPRDRTGLPRSLQRGELRAGGDIVNALLERDEMVVRDGRIVIPGSAQLRRAVSGRELNIFDGDVPWPSFTLSLRRYPTKEDMAWTGWYPPDDAGIIIMHARQSARGYQIRYRVVLD